MSIYGDDAIGILVDHSSLGVHAESSHPVSILLGAVDDFAFVKLVRQVRENLGGQLHPDADIHPVGFCGDAQVTADGFHPFAAAAANGDDAVLAEIGRILTQNFIAVLRDGNGQHCRVKEKRHFILEIIIEVCQNHIVDIRTQMPDRSIQQMQVILNAEGFESAAGSGVELCPFAAIAKINLVHITHQIQSLFFSDIFKQCSAKIIGDVVFSVGKSTCAAKSAHNAAAFAANTGLYLLPVDGAAPLVQRMTRLKNSHLQLRPALHQLIGRKDSTGACTDNNDIILHCFSSLSCTALL